MAVGRFLTFHKCCLIFTTFLIGVLGLGLICSGLWIRLEPDFRRYVNQADNFNFLYAGAYVVICVGIVVAVVAALGCFGAIKNNICIIVTYFIAVLIFSSVYTTMVAAAILAVLQKQTLLQLLGNSLKELLSKYYEDAPSKQLMSAIQKQFSCCGADKGISDYVTYTLRKNHPGVCPLELFGQPCNVAVVEQIEKNALTISVVAATVAIVMFIGLIQSMFLCRAIRDLHSRAELNGGSSISNRVMSSSSLHDDIKVTDSDHQRRQQLQQQKQQKQKQNATEPRVVHGTIDR